MIKPAVVEKFFTERGWTRTPLDMGWRFERREDLEAVVRIEFTPGRRGPDHRVPLRRRGRLRDQPLEQDLLKLF